MKLQIERKYVEAMVNEFPGLAALNDQLRFGNKAEVSFKQRSNTELSFLQTLYKKAGTEMQGHVALLSTLQKAMNDDTEHDLEMLLPAIARYLINDAIRGWLFQTNVAGKPMAYVVTRLDFTPSGEEETGRVTLELKANAKGKVAISTITIRARNISADIGCIQALFNIPGHGSGKVRRNRTKSGQLKSQIAAFGANVIWIIT